MAMPQWAPWHEWKALPYRELSSLPAPLEDRVLQRAVAWGCEQLYLDPRRVRLAWMAPEADAAAIKAAGHPTGPAYTFRQVPNAATVPEAAGCVVLLTKEWMQLGMEAQVQILWHELAHVAQYEHENLRWATARDSGGTKEAYYEQKAEKQSWGLMLAWERGVRGGTLPRLW